jgi:hypothetical protein
VTSACLSVYQLLVARSTSRQPHLLALIRCPLLPLPLAMCFVQELGVQILSDLQRQRETILHSRDTLHTVDTNISRSRQILQTMSRRIMQNKARGACSSAVLECMHSCWLLRCCAFWRKQAWVCTRLTCAAGPACRPSCGASSCCYWAPLGWCCGPSSELRWRSCSAVDGLCVHCISFVCTSFC